LARRLLERFAMIRILCGIRPPLSTTLRGPQPKLSRLGGGLLLHRPHRSAIEDVVGRPRGLSGRDDHRLRVGLQLLPLVVDVRGRVREGVWLVIEWPPGESALTKFSFSTLRLG
jgi:hypothetical protein